MSLAHRLRSESHRLRRRACELVGSDRYSRPARDDLDRKIAKYLPDKGFFIEAGALDGFTASNTYYLEKIKGWTGLLVEPNPPEYVACVRERPRSQVFQCALVADEVATPTVTLNYGADLSFVEGAYTGERRAERDALLRRYRPPESFSVPARTLTSLLDEIHASQVDFLSLDVEGYELEVLRGLDMARFAPQTILIECQTAVGFALVSKYLAPTHSFCEALSRHDYFFKCKP